MKHKFLLIGILLIGLLLSGSQLMAQSATPTPANKQIAAPPSDFAQIQLPEAAHNGVSSHAAMLPVTLSRQANGSYAWKSQMRLDGRDIASMLLLAPGGDSWDVALQNANGRSFSLTAADAPGRAQLASVGMGNAQVNGRYFQLATPVSGQMAIKISAPATTQQLEGFMVVASETPYQLYTHLSSYDLLAGNQVGLVTRLYDATEAGETAVPAPLSGVISSASMTVTLPDGTAQTVPMFDNGAANDGAANDGVYGGLLTAAAVGEYTAQVTVEGVSPDGVPFVRTSEHIFPVLERTLELANNRVRSRQFGNRILLTMWGRALNGPVGDVIASAEVWGMDSNGDMVPVAWISGQVDPVQRLSFVQIPLYLDTGWVDMAGAQGPYELRNVRIQDVETAVPLAQVSSMSATITYKAAPFVPGQAVQVTPTEEMLMGPRPVQTSRPQPPGGGNDSMAINYNDNRVLMLVHGYCSNLVWPTNHFSDYTVFNDTNQNRSHNQFAQLIGSYGSQFDSFGIVAHSQGGAASLHLYTYYWSGLDYSSGNRLIQSVGTPYQGTSLAGNLAVLGSVFGVGCGTNWDLTYDGASLWLANIPSWARSRVYYYTTSFTDKWWRYDYCQIVSDVFLSDPDDGTTEKWAGQLSGANNMGHKTGQCHTTGMRDMPQYQDSNRNSIMNSNANR